ncbi:hypothetical protein [uncultured Pelagimonas sp.]|uniref:calcium-binding protein n=1 Tax=uncultured Pelagimonas sp. TaxID=1618102 RepID=UPI0026288F7B|nr:hypothetical protein [uncultured Pelagimonas sp.]
MSAALIALLAIGLLTPLMFGSDDSSSDGDPAQDPDDPQGLDVNTLDSNPFAGTDGNDTIDLDPRDGGFNSMTLETGAGDDLLDLTDAEAFEDRSTLENAVFQNSTIQSGEGDDTIHVGGANLEIDGGGGNDDITALEADFATIEGGAGDDRIHTTTTGQPASVYGGEGNDTLSGVDAADLFGEAGDDLIEFNGDGGTGDRFYMVADGGEGDDTIAATDTAITDADLDRPHVLTGGAGSDLFELRFDEGSLRTYGVPVESDGTLQLEVFNISDFEPGTDQIEIELEVENDGYSVASARIEGTDLIIRYEHADDEPIRDIVIPTGATGLTFDDITFVGDHIPTVLQEDEPQVVTDLTATSFAGTDGNDTLDLNLRDGGFEGVLVNAGAGDDFLDLSDRESVIDPATADAVTWSDSTVIGGEGDDTIQMSGNTNLVQGGVGADDITALDAGFSTIEGGEGNDVIHIATSLTGPGSAYGGEGDDTLSGSEAAGLFGEAGNDYIEVHGYGDGGAGYFVTGNGGEGDDTLAFSDSAITRPFDGFDPNTLIGGTGSDTFDITLSEGSEDYNGSLLRSGTIRLGAINIGDFEPGVDQIELELEVENDGYSVASARIEGEDLIIRYEHADDEPIRDIVIPTGATGLTFDDITFVGENQPPVLVPAA